MYKIDELVLNCYYNDDGVVCRVKNIYQEKWGNVYELNSVPYGYADEDHCGRFNERWLRKFKDEDEFIDRISFQYSCSRIKREKLKRVFLDVINWYKNNG